MFNVNLETGEITMHRGDTGSYKLHAARKSGDAWTADDRLIYTIKNQQGEVVLQRFYRLDDQWDLGDGVVLIEFHNDDTDDWANGTYGVEWRYVISPIWEGTAPTSRCADALTADARIVEGSIVRVPENGQSTMNINDIYGEV
jgi:hypothetical protein